MPSMICQNFCFLGASYNVLAAAEGSTQEAPRKHPSLPINGREFTPNRQPFQEAHMGASWVLPSVTSSTGHSVFSLIICSFRKDFTPLHMFTCFFYETLVISLAYNLFGMTQVWNDRFFATFAGNWHNFQRSLKQIFSQKSLILMIFFSDPFLLCFSQIILEHIKSQDHFCA